MITFQYIFFFLKLIFGVRDSVVEFLALHTLTGVVMCFEMGLVS